MKDNTNFSVLVVDDAEENREFVSFMLRKIGYQVASVGSGNEALLSVETCKPHLILLDIQMPGMDGIAVLKELRTKYSLLELPIIMVTADDNDKSVVTALSIGANDYLIKPINPAVTAARVNNQISLAYLSELKDDFVRFASHDLKKPMILISDIVDMALDQDAKQNMDVDELLDSISLIQKTNSRMQDIVNNFLIKEEPFETAAKNKVALEVNEIIKELCKENESYALGKKIILETFLDNSLPAVNSSGFKIRQVLDNYIGNAIKFCLPGSTVKVVSKLDENNIRVEVLDNGPGLTDDDYQKLFQRDVKLSNRPTGKETSTGIGLPLCKELISSLKGKTGAYPNKATGVVFWFSLPVE